MPILKKTPLARCGDTFYTSNHDLSNEIHAKETCLLLHFKFTADFEKKVAYEANRGEHFRGGAEYILYKKQIDRLKGITVYDESHSSEFNVVSDVEKYGLMGNMNNVVVV